MPIQSILEDTLFNYDLRKIQIEIIELYILTKNFNYTLQPKSEISTHISDIAWVILLIAEK